MSFIKITFCLFFLTCSDVVFSQSFDEFTLDKEVAIFTKKSFDELKNFELGIKCPEEENQWYLDSLEYSPWYVGDFNGDEIPDLFITGTKKKEQVSYLIFGKDELDEESNFSMISVYPPKERGNLIIPFIEERKKELWILFRHFKTKTTTSVRDGQEIRLPRTYNDYYKLGLIKKDTLIYRFGNILEYNPKPVKNEIRFIQLHAYCQFGGCPDYKIKIDSAANMILANIKNNEEVPGKYTSVCAAAHFNQLFELANYLKLQKSNQVFGEESADKTFTMIIAYQDGSAKTWYDYEQGASLGISRLYDLIVKVKETASWEFAQE